MCCLLQGYKQRREYLQLQKAVRLLQAAFRRHLGSTAQRDSRAHSAAECLLRFVVAFHGQSQLRLAVKHVQRAGEQLLRSLSSAVYMADHAICSAAAVASAAAVSSAESSQHTRQIHCESVKHVEICNYWQAQRRHKPGLLFTSALSVSIVSIGSCYLQLQYVIGVCC
jgi:hypothetical protein